MFADFQLLPVAVFTAMIVLFVIAMLYGVLIDRDPA